MVLNSRLMDEMELEAETWMQQLELAFMMNWLGERAELLAQEEVLDGAEEEDLYGEEGGRPVEDSQEPGYQYLVPDEVQPIA